MLKDTFLKSSFLALTVSVFMLVSTDAAAKSKDQSCPSGELLNGYDIYGNAICVIDSTLNPGDFACHCFDKATVQSIFREYPGWRAANEGQCFREEDAVKYVGCEPLGATTESCREGVVAAGKHGLIGDYGLSTDGFLECIISDGNHRLPLFGTVSDPFKYGQALMFHSTQACMNIILEVMEEEGCPREDDCGNGIVDAGEECDWNGDDDCNRECLVQ